MLAGCPEGGVVLDPFSGTATTGLVAIQHGRQYIGIELNPVYVELANRRFVETIKIDAGLDDALFHNPSRESDLTGWSGGIFGTSGATDSLDSILPGPWRRKLPSRREWPASVLTGHQGPWSPPPFYVAGQIAEVPR
jgi:hypothetical protein